MQTVYDYSTGEQIAADTLNTHVDLTVAEIMNLPYCRCGHSADAHFEDGLTEAPTSCADLGRDHQGCLCTGYSGRFDEP